MYSFRPFEITKVEAVGNQDRNIICPTPRSGHRIVVAHGNVYSFGGYNPITMENDAVEHILFKELWVYNCVSQTWRLLRTSGNAPDELASHCATYDRNNLLIFGGTAYPFGAKSSNDVHICNLKTLQWSKLDTSGTPPSKQYGQAMALHENKLYVVGGTTGYAYSNEIHCLSLESLEWTQLFKTGEYIQRNYEPEPRYRHEIAIQNNKIFVFGGGTASDSFALNDLPVFDLSSKKWEKIPTNGDFVSPRRCHSLVQLDNEVYIMGGMNGLENFSDFYKFDLNTLTWCKFLTLPHPLYFHAASVSDSYELFIFGGVAGQLNQRTNDLYRVWLKIPPLQTMCWQAVRHYIPRLAQIEKRQLFRMGIPIRYLDEIEYISPDASQNSPEVINYVEARDEGWEVL